MKVGYLHLLAGVAALAAVAAASPASAAVVFFDDFETDVPALNAGLNNFGVSEGTIDVVASGMVGVTCSGGSGNCVDLDGSSGNAEKSRALPSLAPATMC
jgi:hypothetical protein